MSDLELAFKTLQKKSIDYEKLWSYYDGPQPLKYSTERLRDMFKDFSAHFEQNWCAVVVDTLLDRITLRGLNIENGGLNKALQSVWERSTIALDAFDAHECALVTGEAYLIADRDAEKQPQLYFNDSRMVHLFYNEDNPKVKKFAAKIWRDEGKTHLVLYYPDRMEKYIANKKDISEAKSFSMDGEAIPNDDGEIPVFHVRNGRRTVKSAFGKILPNQDAVNKLFADMMVTAEFMAFKQRYIISQADVSQLKNKPGTILEIPASDGIGQDTQAGEFSETPLENYLTAMDKQANFVAIITKIPKHYFADAGTSGISGDALMALEAPLVKKTMQIQANFSPGWQEAGSFIMKMLGAEVPATMIQPLWQRADTIQPTSEANELNVKVQAGMPLITQLRNKGWTKDELDQLIKDQDEARKKSATLGKMLLEKARNDQANMNAENLGEEDGDDVPAAPER